MDTKKIIAAGIAGTTAFTLFSYLMSVACDEDFREPELIGKMLNRLPTDLSKKQSRLAGWISHYLVGIAFAATYKLIIEKTQIKPSIKNGLITGALSGYPASLTWDKALQLHPAPPRKRSLFYYGQLVIGHAIFGAVAFTVLKQKKHKM